MRCDARFDYYFDLDYSGQWPASQQCTARPISARFLLMLTFSSSLTQNPIQGASMKIIKLIDLYTENGKAALIFNWDSKRVVSRSTGGRLLISPGMGARLRASRQRPGANPTADRIFAGKRTPSASTAVRRVCECCAHSNRDWATVGLSGNARHVS